MAMSSMRPRSTLLRTLQVALFICAILLFIWTLALALRAGGITRHNAPGALVGLAIMLGTGAPLLPGQHPRLRWALLLASIAACIPALVMLGG